MPGHPTPQTMAETRHEMIRWFRTNATAVWPSQHLGGSKFVAPPSLPPIKAKAYGYDVNTQLGSAIHLGDGATIKQFKTLAEYYAESCEQARTYYIGQELSHLAMRTEMPHYRLSLDMLPSPTGFLVWALPIGDAEKFTPRHAWLSPDGTLTEDVSDPGNPKWNPFLEADFPVIGVLWRYDPDHHIVWISFYTKNDAIGSTLPEMSREEMARFRSTLPPMNFEREQALPMDQTLGWFDDDLEEGPRLELTAQADMEGLPPELHALGRQRNEEARPQLTQQVRTLVATWMLMKWKIANREVVPPPPYAVKQIARETGRERAEVKADNATVFVRLGQPLKHRKPREGAAAWKWSHRTIIGPYIRTRQYIPAHDRYDETPRLIEPYIAGPPDKPISNTEKVFLLD